MLFQVWIFKTISNNTWKGFPVNIYLQCKPLLYSLTHLLPFYTLNLKVFIQIFFHKYDPLKLNKDFLLNVNFILLVSLIWDCSNTLPTTICYYYLIFKTCTTTADAKNMWFGYFKKLYLFTSSVLSKEQ